jgi:hypothetical protein
MSLSARVAPLTLAAVALALTLTGVIYAATDANPGAIAKDPLALNGYPPKSAEFQIKVSTGQAYSLNATVDVNFKTDSAQAQLLVPLLFSATQINLRLVHDHLYVGSPNLSSIFGSTWVATPVKTPSLFGLSLELTKPDVSLISGLGHETVTKSGYSTTYAFQRDNVILATPSKSPVKLPTSFTVDVSITVGSQGELSAATVSESSKSSTLIASLNVVSYNHSVHVSAPPSREVKAVNLSQIEKLLAQSPFKDLLSPQNLGSLGEIQLN